MSSQSLAIKICLKTSNEEKTLLLQTIELVNQACNEISRIAFKNKISNRIRLHNHKIEDKISVYDYLIEKYNFPSQIAICIIGKVTNSYKTNTKTLQVFQKREGVVYDGRILSFSNSKASIRVLEKRIKLDFNYKTDKSIDIDSKVQESKLLYDKSKNKFFLHRTFKVENQEEKKSYDDVIGIDRGIKNLVYCNDNYFFKSEESIQKKNKISKTIGEVQRRKARKQSRKTKTSRRLLKRLSQRRNRMTANINHTISKNIVINAINSNSAIAIENLKGISKQRNVSKKHRNELHKWSFYQLEEFLEYKALLNGITIIKVNPEYTSQICHKCNVLGNRNREKFSCSNNLCNYDGHSDYNASQNIKNRGIDRLKELGVTVINPDETTSIQRI
jgi:putative transposase